MLCRIISVIIWFLWWGWTEGLGLSTLKYFVNADETRIYSIQQAFILCFQNLYDGQSWPTSSLQPPPSPCLTLSLQQYKNAKPAPFHPAPWFLRRGLLQTYRAIPLPEVWISDPGTALWRYREVTSAFCFCCWRGAGGTESRFEGGSKEEGDQMNTISADSFQPRL